LLAIVGPTASGKSALAVALAERFGGEVLACDSTQVYRGFDVGTAKPSPSERRGVPHHMMDLADPSETFTAGEYRRRALPILEDLRRRERLPILTVGTGLYLRALLEGLADAPERSESLRARLARSARRRGESHLHTVLRRLDPLAAARISAKDRQKLVRAIEVCILAGKPITDVHRAGRQPLEGYSVVKIGLTPPRAALYQRIAARTEEMLRGGWLDEVSGLLARGEPPSAKPFDFIGYRYLRDHLQSGQPLDTAAQDPAQAPARATVQNIAQATCRYAKRQLTWFRKEPGVAWFIGFGDDPAILDAVVAHLAPRLTVSEP